MRRYVYHNNAASGASKHIVNKIFKESELPPSRLSSIGNLIENNAKPKKNVEKMIKLDPAPQVAKRFWYFLQRFYEKHGAVAVAELKKNGIDFTPTTDFGEGVSWEEGLIAEMEL